MNLLSYYGIGQSAKEIRQFNTDDTEVIAEGTLEIEKTLDLSRFLQTSRNEEDNNRELESKLVDLEVLIKRKIIIQLN
ncbi:18885_t:CDS:2 [Funneliformis geosporum]|uniref:17886_t:CDS:1 n=1 Tax=Funneliformis geosporum TaxID=1117311 RepID=A0A9W4SS36_9GLOM|nr:18885_t:CDS:2 [Funneliformis geosporum]CAI2178520.1 17886_t:CDS:2 [Funneliformis geosporum]